MRKLITALLAICFTWNIYAQTGSIFVDEDHNGKRIFNIATPTVGADVTNKTYVDSVAGGGAPTTAHYVTTQAEAGLSAEFNLGSLSSGILKQSVTTGVATPAIAVSSDIIGLFSGCSGSQYLGADGACHTAGTGNVTSVDISSDVSWLTATGGPITSSGTLEVNGNFPNDSSLFLDGTGTFVAIPGSGSGVSQLISGGGVAWTGTGFNYIISAATYLINGVQYSSAQTPVTLDAADPSDDRFDAFYVDSSGLADVLTGTPGAGIAPSVDPSSQLLLTTAQVPAGSSAPTITNENIYLEDTEYTMSASAGTIVLNSTNNPFAGTKDIEGTATVSGNFFTALKPSGTLDLSQYTQLVFQIRSKATWPSNKGISIFWLNGTTVTGSSVGLKNGTFGFNSSNTSTYQQIVIPAANFGTGTLPVDRLRMSVSGGGAAIGWYIDNIILQAGGGGGGGGGTVTNFTAGNLSPLFTTSVTNPTTAPNLSFTLSTAGANTHYANATGSTAAPAFTADAALTKTDDTNVTLTLGGSASTALLHAASLTLGWTGTLAVSRGGTGAATASAHNYFGNNTGSTAAPAFHQIDYSEITGTPAPITPAALTKSDDTNVTLTLGGTPTTALLQATSLTLGWAGQLALSRGGTAANLSDPGANRLWGWDDTDNSIGFWTIGSNLSYDHSTHTLSATSSGAPTDAHYVTTQAESGLSAESSLGALSTGVLKGTVSGSVSTLSSLASTTVGENVLTLTNPSAISFIKIAADNSVSTRTPANVVADLSGQAAADFSMNTHKITSVTNPSSAQDAATKNYVDTHVGGGVSGTLFADAPNSTVDIAVTSGSPATLVSKSITYTAGDQVRFDIWGAILNNSGSPRTYSLKYNLGSLNATQVFSATIAASATARSPIHIRVIYTVASSSSAWLLVDSSGFNAQALGTTNATSTVDFQSLDQHSASDLTGAQTTSVQMFSSANTATQSFELHAWSIQQTATNP